MQKSVKTGYGDITVGTHEIDRRFRSDFVVVKTESDMRGYSQAKALNLAAALLEVVSDLVKPSA